MKKLILFISAATLLFVPLFVFRGIGPFDFWWWMSFNLLLLTGAAWFYDREYRKNLRSFFSRNIAFNIFMGIFSALLLFAVFKTGNLVSRALFDFAGTGIDSIYYFKGDATHLRIALLMLLIIGPGEELLWRGFFQKHFEDRLGPWKGYIAAALFYAAVHVATLNIMLILAALTCGLFWGFLYMRYKSLLMICLSHTLWDIAVFILFPFN
jgi:membrane protease YdiL (CAAX protease family)